MNDENSKSKVNIGNCSSQLPNYQTQSKKRTYQELKQGSTKYQPRVYSLPQPKTTKEVKPYQKKGRLRRNDAKNDSDNDEKIAVDYDDEDEGGSS